MQYILQCSESAYSKPLTSNRISAHVNSVRSSEPRMPQSGHRTGVRFHARCTRRDLMFRVGTHRCFYPHAGRTLYRVVVVSRVRRSGFFLSTVRGDVHFVNLWIFNDKRADQTLLAVPAHSVRKNVNCN